MADTALVAVPVDDKLDPRERRFVKLYVDNPNGTQAVLAAGYDVSIKSAGVYAHKLLKKGKIQKAIAIEQAKFMQRYEVTPQRLTAEFAKLAFSNIDDFISIQDDGSVIVDFGTATREQLASLASIEVDEYVDGRGENAQRVKRMKFKQYDKEKALVELAKLARMYPAERTELTGPNGGPMQHQVLAAHKIDIASLDPEAREGLRGVLLALKSKAGDTAEEED